MVGVRSVLLVLLAFGALPAWAAVTVVNGDFAEGLTGWTTEGEVEDGGGFAVLTDQSAAVSAVYQTFEVSQVAGGLALSFFTQGMSGQFQTGELPDSAFLTLYLGDQAFGSSVENPIFDEVIALADLDSNGLRLLSPGVQSGPTPGRLGWQTLYLPVPVTYRFATLAIEMLDQNFVDGDSVSTLDGVEPVPLRRNSLTYAVWLTLWFREEERSDPVLVDPESDPDGDGNSNVFEFYAGTVPTVPDAIPVRALLVREGAGPHHLALEVRRSVAATGVDATLELSSELQSWEEDPGAVEVSSRPGDTVDSELVIVRAADPVAASPQRYARLRVTLRDPGP